MGLPGGRQLRRTHEVDEQDRDLPLVVGNRFGLLDGATDHFFSDVPAEQVTQVVALLQTCDHAVESGLQLPDFGTLINVDHVADVPAFHLCHRVDDLVQRIRNR